MLYHAERVEPLLEEEPQWCDICGNIGADLYLSLTDEYRTPEDQLKEVVSTKFYIHVVCLASRLRVARHDVRDLANQRRANQARRAAQIAQWAELKEQLATRLALFEAQAQQVADQAKKANRLLVQQGMPLWDTRLPEGS